MTTVQGLAGPLAHTKLSVNRTFLFLFFDSLGAFYWNRSFLMIREQVSLTLNKCSQ